MSLWPRKGLKAIIAWATRPPFATPSSNAFAAASSHVHVSFERLDLCRGLRPVLGEEDVVVLITVDGGSR
jgi:hypothetical protein